MFKKLKEKITEEVKSSPQRLQQFTQSVSDRLQNSTASDENFFSIGDDDANTSSPSMESGFSTVNLTSPDDSNGRMRRNSNSSIASDVSFLPRYESSTSTYHLQSDLDVSASEIEDNASTSSQLGHLSKEQIYAAFQKAQLRYHKYRGRFTDLAKHYKELERENGKMKSVLVETQDKAIRRSSELKEQCLLEQKAKAHLENALRVELDEKQYKIDVLQTKIELLQKSEGKTKASELLVEALENGDNLDTLKKDLNDAREEIESLNGKLQETKANAIIFQSKETDYKTKITNLEKQLMEVSEREKENSLKLAESKMELHNEINSKDAEISRLKADLEALKQNLDNNKSTKLDNLQSQNKKLIEKIEALGQKCSNYDSDMLKMEQYKINATALKEDKEKLEAELKVAKKTLEDVQKQLDEACEENSGLSKLKESYEELKKVLEEQKLVFETKITEHQNEAKKSLINIEGKIRAKLQEEFALKEKTIKEEFEEKLKNVGTNNDTLKETHLKLLAKEDEVKKLEGELKTLKEESAKSSDSYKELEQNHLELIEEGAGQRNEIANLNKEITKMKGIVEDLETQLGVVKEEKMQLSEGVKRLETETADYGIIKVGLAKSLKEIEELNKQLVDATNERKKLEEVLTEKESQRAILEETLRNLQGQLSKKQNLLEEVKAMEEKIVHLEDLNGRLKEKLEAITNNSEEKLAITETLNEDNKKLKNDLQESSKKLKTTEDELKSTKSALEIKEKDLEKLSEDLRQIHTQKDNLREVLEKTQKEAVISEEKLKKISAQNEHLQNTLEGLQSEILTLQENLQKAQKVKGSLEEILQKTNEENKHLRETLQGVQTEINLLRENLGKAHQDNEHLRENLQKLEGEKKQLQDQTEDLGNRNLSDQKQIGELHEENEGLKTQMQTLRNRLSETEASETAHSKLLVQLDDYEKKVKRLQQKVVELSTSKDDLEKSDENNRLLTNELGSLRKKLQEVSAEKTTLQEYCGKLKEYETKFGDIREENDKLKSCCSKQNEELSELRLRNNQISNDYKTIVDENHSLLAELEETKIKIENIQTHTKILEETVQKLQKERDDFEHKLKQSVGDVQKLQNELKQLKELQQDENVLAETKTELEQLKNVLNEVSAKNKSLQNDMKQMNSKHTETTDENQRLKAIATELEKHTTELTHEKQLLLDEINELKASPINTTNLTKTDDTKYTDEIDRLRDKVVKYKSLDLTNRSSIEFYENELEKLRNKNDKLNRKLDETLVTLNHCTELSNSTEIEYLKNVLYNYMLGKESLVLARVIAAVCKFDQQQTETVLQKEQQKQTLLGQLGIL